MKYKPAYNFLRKEILNMTQFLIIVNVSLVMVAIITLFSIFGKVLYDLYKGYI